MKVFHAIYLVLLSILIVSQVVSKFMMSGMQILLTVNWLLEMVTVVVIGKRRGGVGWKLRMAQGSESNALLKAYLVLMAVHAVWLIGTNNMSYGLEDIFRKLPLLAIPVVVLTSKPLGRREVTWLLICYVGAVFVSTMIGLVRHITIADLPYRDTVPFISHIRFSLNICVAIVLLMRTLSQSRSTDRRARVVRGVAIVLIVWFIAFLLILRSYTAFIVLYVTAWVMLMMPRASCQSQDRTTHHRLISIVVMVVTTLAVALVANHYVRSYYGEYYSMLHCGATAQRQDKQFVENGRLLNEGVKRAELERQWGERSVMRIYDTTANGYTVYPTLVRYLNASGLSKDSVGVTQLSDRDIALIEKGVANPVYAEGSVIEKMAYTLLFEYENYRVNGNIRNSSFLERIELWRGAWRVFCDNPLFGVGTGDGVDELHRRLQEEGSQISDTEKHAHNQYLSFLVSFGIVGFLLISIAFFYAFRKISLRRNPAYFAIVLILLLSFISEDTLETLAGCVLCTLIPCLMAKNAKNA